MITPGVLFVILTAAILLLIVIVAIIERILVKKQNEANKTPEYGNTNELEELKSAKLEPQQMIEKIDLLAKKTLWTNVNLEDAPDYSQLAEQSADKPRVAEFCSEMAKTLYGGQSITATEVKKLIKILEETLKEEGKVLLVEQKHEKIEQERFFLDAWIENIASIVNTKLQEWKERKAANQALTTLKEEVKTIAPENVIKDINPAEELRKLKVKITPEKSKPLSEKKKEKEKEEYQYIESVDVLDRIQNKIKNRNVLKEN